MDYGRQIGRQKHDENRQREEQRREIDLSHYIHVAVATLISYLILCVTCAHVTIKGDEGMLMLIIEMSALSSVITATLDYMKGKWKQTFGGLFTPVKSNKKRRHK